MNACEQYYTSNIECNSLEKSNRKPYKYVDKKYNFVKEITKVESIKRTELSEKQKLDSVVHMQANSQEMKCI